LVEDLYYNRRDRLPDFPKAFCGLTALVKNLDECYSVILSDLFSDCQEDIRTIDAARVILLKYDLFNYLDLNGDGQLTQYFNDHSISDPDEMAEIIAYGVWLHLNSEKCELEDVNKFRRSMEGKAQDYPKSLNECFQSLSNRLSDEELEQFRQTDENDIIVFFHFGLGSYIRSNLGLFCGVAPLTKFFIEKEVFHPDDMSSIILYGFWLYLNSKPCDYDSVSQFYASV
jgi:hypothetical protein